MIDDIRILILGNDYNKIVSLFAKRRNPIFICPDKIDLDYIKDNEIDFVIIYRYRHSIPKEVLDYLPKKIIELHLSYLPYNRGADPNLWSFLEDTPKGVTIHYVDEGVNTGDMIVREQVDFINDDYSETLFTTYQFLNNEVIQLLEKNLDFVLADYCESKKQTGKFTIHKSKDKNKYRDLLNEGWNTSIVKIRGMALYDN